MTAGYDPIRRRGDLWIEHELNAGSDPRSNEYERCRIRVPSDESPQLRGREPDRALDANCWQHLIAGNHCALADTNAAGGHSPHDQNATRNEDQQGDPGDP